MTLNEQLQTLETADLIRLAAAPPDLEYTFRHALVHEATYASLVRADRKRLHGLVGDCLERLVGAGLAPDLAAALARHFDNASDKRALPYAVLAAEAAAGRYANREAVAYYDLVLAWARRDPATSSEQLAAWHAARGRALELNGQFAEALEAYRGLAQLGVERQDKALTLRALVLQGTLRATVNPMFNIAEAERLATEGLALARETGDRAAEGRIHWNRSNYMRFSGRFLEARESGEASLALARESGEPKQLALTLNDLAHIYGMGGAWPEHRAAIAEAAERWRALGDLPMLADSLATAALYGAFGGDYETAQRNSHEASEIARSIGNVWGQSYSLSGYGYVLLARGEYAACVQTSYECLRLAEEAGYLAPPIMNGAILADALADLGQTEAALHRARLALEYADGRVMRLRDVALGAVAMQLVTSGAAAEAADLIRTANIAGYGDVVWAAEPIRRAMVEAALALRSPDAMRLAEVRLAAVRRQAMRPYIAEALETLSRAQRQAGQPEAARASLLDARAMCEQLGARRILWRVLRGLAAVAQTETDKTTLMAASREVVAAIASELTERNWREGFLRHVEEWTLETDY
jgi:hypothetical protein